MAPARLRNTTARQPQTRDNQNDLDDDDILPANSTGRIPGDDRIYRSKGTPGINSGRQVVYCESTENGLRCSYHCRKDRFMKKWRRTTKNGTRPELYVKHECTYAVPVDQTDITSFFSLAPPCQIQYLPQPPFPRSLQG